MWHVFRMDSQDYRLMIETDSFQVSIFNTSVNQSWDQLRPCLSVRLGFHIDVPIY